MLKLPDDIKQEMRSYRAGFQWNVPDSYIDFHHKHAAFDAQNQDWVIVENHGLTTDGWCDGMKYLQLTVAYKDDNQWKIGVVKWHESGAWFIKGAGWTRFREMKEC